jgi:hypothetical protein
LEISIVTLFRGAPETLFWTDRVGATGDVFFLTDRFEGLNTIAKIMITIGNPIRYGEIL